MKNRHRAAQTSKSSARFPKGQVPLYRALSKLGYLSRTAARTAIETGDVTVNGAVVLNPEQHVVPETANIAVGGVAVKAVETRLIVFHKPRKAVTTRSDPQGRQTVYAFFENELPHFHAVGRLDYHTSGLLLFTNDTRLSSRLTDPANRISRQYLATVRGNVTDAELPLFTGGVMDKGEMLTATQVDVRKRSNRESQLIITLTGGKNREIRRLCKALRHEVTKLKRISFGPVALGDLPPGAHREASPDELMRCKEWSQR